MRVRSGEGLVALEGTEGTKAIKAQRLLGLMDARIGSVNRRLWNMSFDRGLEATKFVDEIVVYRMRWISEKY